MKKSIHQIRFGLLIAAVFLIVSFVPKRNADTANQELANTQVQLKLITNKVPSPVAMGVPRDGTDRLFFCQKEGKVWIVEKGKLLTRPFLDVSKRMVKVDPRYDERGLLGIAFHPDFKVNHKFYVYYSAPSSDANSNNKSILAEYQVSGNNPNVADYASERILLEIEEPESNHNGGDLVFGPDGYLYITVGDGGGGGDQHGTIGNGQNLETLLGKILRIDVNGEPYKIPSDNPFVNNKEARPEIWAYGVRNPWRMSFDRQTKQLFAGDVGQNKYEEIDIIKKGGNYGWRIKEGFHDYNVPSGSHATNLIDPIYEYDHGTGISITGGYVYRGKAIPQLTGKYVYGDYNGKTWVLSNNNNKWENSDLTFTNKPQGSLQILSWGEDVAGELYMLTNVVTEKGATGTIYKLVKSGK